MARAYDTPQDPDSVRRQMWLDERGLAAIAGPNKAADEPDDDADEDEDDNDDLDDEEFEGDDDDDSDAEDEVDE
jgi:hypothetical protein